MKTLFCLFAFLLMSNTNIFGKELSFPFLNTGDSCQFGPKLWLLDNNEDNKFDYLVYGGCPKKAKVFNLTDKSLNQPMNIQKAILINGNILENNFLIYLFDSVKTKYTHEIYYDYNHNVAILNDYSSDNQRNSAFEEVDRYFYTKQIGSKIFIRKKADINVLSLMLCNLNGQILYYNNNVEFWYQYTFDLSTQPSGLYLVRFIVSDNRQINTFALTKKILYLK